MLHDIFKKEKLWEKTFWANCFSLLFPSLTHRGSKADMAAAATEGEVPPGDEERIYDNEQLPQYN